MLLVDLSAHAVRESGRCGLIDDAQHLEASDLAGILGALALGIVEIRRNGDDGFLHRLAEILLGDAFHLAQDDSRNFGTCEDLAPDLDARIIIGTAHDLVGT